MRNGNQRLCFWTTAVQSALVLQYADYYGVSRSFALQMIVRRQLHAEMNKQTTLGDRLQGAYNLLMSSPYRSVKEQSMAVVDNGLDAAASEEVPF